MHTTEDILRALSGIRAPLTHSEYDLHALVAGALDAASIVYRHEAPVATRRRVDFLCGSVCVEVKRGRPLRTPLLRQLAAYASSPLVEVLIVVAERSPALPCTVGGKPLRAVSLDRLWGIAL